MSTGDKGNDPYPFSIFEARKIVALAIVQEFLRRQYVVNAKDWDIPYLAGYSRDGRTIFIDRDLQKWPYRGRMISTNRFLELHEHVEKSLIDALHEAQGAELAELLRALRMKTITDQIYYHPHGVATAVEEYEVSAEFGSDGLHGYNLFMRTQIKRAEDERIRRVPRTLDMTPYRGTDRMDERLRMVMEAHMT